MLLNIMLEHPKRLFLIATLLLVLGVALPFLMVLRVVESTFFLNFLSYGMQILGLLLGIVSMAGYRLGQKKRSDKENPYK